MTPRFGIREGMLAIALVALVVVAVIQGRKIVDQDRRIARLEAQLSQLRTRNERLNAAGVQFGNVVNRLSQSWAKDSAELRREIGALKKEAAPPAAGTNP